MKIHNVTDIQVDAAYTAVILDNETVKGENGEDEIIPAVVYLPSEACIYFKDASTIEVEI